MSLPDITEQLEKYSSMLANDPRNMRLSCDTAELFARSGQFAEARHTIELALDINRLCRK